MDIDSGIATANGLLAEVSKMEPLNTGGWIVMTCSVGLVLLLVTYCLGRVLLDGDEREEEAP